MNSLSVVRAGIRILVGGIPGIQKEQEGKGAELMASMAALVSGRQSARRAWQKGKRFRGLGIEKLPP